MIIKPSSATNAAASSSSSNHSTTCGNCGLEEKRLLHHIRHRGNFRRLCTTCVLRLNAQCFCPTCFVVYAPSPPPSAPSDFVTCFKCYSSSHASCVGSNVPSPYICPLCINPNSQIFVLKKVKDSNSENSQASNGKGVANGEYRVIDKKAAKVLLAAAKIASVSMNKAAVAAREEAVRRAKEAAIARKRAREALEHVAYLVAKEKARKKELGTTDMSGSGASAGGGRIGGTLERGDNLGHVGSSMSGRVGNLNGRVMGMGMTVEERQRLNNLGRVDRSNEVLAALNAVELREGNKMTDRKAENPALGKPPNGVVPMDVEENPVLVDGEAILDDHGAGSRNGRSGNLDHGRQGDNLSNRSVVNPPVEDRMKNRDINQPGKLNGSVSGQGAS